ncbi:MAG: VWA domain-containing protein, partial [Planctomycetota bacterium]|nr:VWA domain-containing protein [Planctomycetota bacterium]
MLRRTPAFGSLPAASALEASIDLSREAAHAAVMDWVSRYVPAWGTSIVLHAAVALLAAFMATQTRPESPPVPGIITFRPMSLPRLAAPDRSTSPQTTVRGRPEGMTKETSAERQPLGLTLDKIPGLGQGPAQDFSPVIGTGGNPTGGTVDPFGTRCTIGTTLFPPAPDLPPGSEPRIVYVVDRSGSMTDSFEFVKYELKRSLQDLPETAQFHILFFSSGPPMEMSARRLMAATDRNRGIAMEFIDSVISTGGTDPVQALERAFAVQPDYIYLLTDGEFDKAIVDYVKRLNVGGRVKVNTIGFLY